MLDTQKLKMSFSSSPLVIPVLRHWDPFFHLDASIKCWNDIVECYPSS
ncbi:hypothetical protein [Wolbachia endosymbiont (group B) of Idaea biselata]